ncbi:MAG: ROK family protein [Candidatus Kaiserbacteria bacterium]|nr:ROK family protein [Candidatus Kaiserbacteria bacterium]
MYILADIGGTNMRIARSRDLASFDEPIIQDTPQEYEAGIAKLIEASRSLAGAERVDAVSIGMPGSIAPDKRSSRNRSTLMDWSQKPLADDIEQALASTVKLENDTALVGLGEAVFGAGKGAPIVAYITVSTGVNGVRVVDERIDRSAMGFEIGGQYTPFSSEITFEHLVSGRDVERKYGKHPRDLGKDWDGWAELARITAYALNNTILHWSPDRVVFGGSMFNEIGISVGAVRTELSSIMQKFDTLPEIVHSSLGGLGGLYGGLAYLRDR